MQKTEKEYLQKDAIVDETVYCFIINLGEKSSSESSDDFAEEEDDNLSGVGALPDSD